MKRSLVPLMVLFLSLTVPASAQDMRRDSKAPDGGSMMAADPAKAVFDLRGMAPGVIPFTSEAGAQAIAARKKVVYFFAASWCPTCREAYRDLKANASSVPVNLAIVVVDYDNSAALKTKYGVTSQHTFVIIGSRGEKLKIWSGSLTLKDIVDNASLR